MNDELRPIDGGSAGGVGDFVFTLNSPSGVGVASEQGFGHVHKHWYKQTISFAEGLELLSKGKSETVDVTVPLADVNHVSPSGFYQTEVNGRRYTPTQHALAQMGTRYGVGTTYPETLRTNSFPGDGAVLATVFAHGQKRLGKEIAESKRMQKNFLLRTRKDGTLRAMLTAGYAIIDNRWFLEVLSKIIPGGRLSHWKGDSDTIFGNVLIPDTIRANEDSDYGGMVSVSNCEIGTRVLGSVPSVFRSICMNGCIWGQKKGTEIRVIHRGKVDYKALEAKIRANIEKQIPLLPQGIERMLGIRAFGTDCAMKPVFGQVALDYKMSKGQATQLLKAHAEESLITPQYRNTLFGVVNAVTRASQQFGPADWVKFEEIGGSLMNSSRGDWDSLTGRARKLKAEVVDEVFSVN